MDAILTPRINPMQLFEENYQLMLGLLPALRERDHFGVVVNGRTDLVVQVIERGRYTTTLSLEKHFHGGVLLRDLHMTVRVYHDARVVEVIGYQECRRVPPPYEVSAPGRYHRGERRQTNQLLNDLLRHYTAFLRNTSNCPSL